MLSTEQTTEWIVEYKAKYVSGMKRAVFLNPQVARDYYNEKKDDGRKELTLTVKRTTIEYETLEQ